MAAGRGSELMRLINLVEVLKEALEEAGAALPPDLGDAELEAMSEADVRRYYQQPAASPATLQQLGARFPPQDAAPELRIWFPALHSSRAQRCRPSRPAAVVLCFHSSGNAEDMWTAEGTGSRRAPSALLEACEAHSWLLMAPQLSGRGQRLREAPLGSLQEVARALLPLVAPAIISTGGRFAVVAHSMGCWAAYELLLLLQEAGLPRPAAACLSAMPWPHIPVDQRPWRLQRLLDEEQFKDECRAWDVNEAVFGAGVWEAYQPMLRADFRLFDEYEPTGDAEEAAAAGPLRGTRLRLFSAARDRRVSRAMVQEWCRYASAAGPGADPAAVVTDLPGHHGFPADPAAKAAWLQQVAAELEAALGC